MYYIILCVLNPAELCQFFFFCNSESTLIKITEIQIFNMHTTHIIHIYSKRYKSFHRSKQMVHCLRLFLYFFFQFRKQSNRVVLVTLVAADCGVATVFFLSFVLLLFYFLCSSIVLQRATAAAAVKTRSQRPGECNTGSTQSNRWNHTATEDFYLFIYFYFLYMSAQ